MGSIAYGTNSDASDVDIYGFCVPSKDIVFPHLDGEIPGFGRQKKRFDQYQQHHIKDQSSGKEYDLSIYSIVKYFHLCMDNNPNMLDSLFVPARCILHSTEVGNMVREHRRMFLHKGSWHKHKGYAYSQLNKMRSQNRHGKRKETYDKYGFDVKFAMHAVRLLYQSEMILTEHDLDLERHREHLKAIRRGEISEEDIRNWASDKEKALERMYENSTLPWGPDEDAIKRLLLNCLEHHYGSLSDALSPRDVLKTAVRDIRDVVDRVRTEIDL